MFGFGAEDDGGDSTVVKQQVYFLNLKPYVSSFEFPTTEDIMVKLDEIFGTNEYVLDILRFQRTGQYYIYIN